MKDTRIRCTHCGSVTWSGDYGAFMRDHDRPRGGVCRKSREELAKLIAGEDPTP